MRLSTGQSQSQPRGGNGAALRILVVDDEQYMCDVCARTLQRNGYDVVTTNDPEAAIRLLGGELRFDLLLTDIKMPGLSGLDLAFLAREGDPAIAIIIMTGFASKENLQQSVQRGVADFLAKPFELDQLRLAVDQALHKRSLLQDNLRLRALEQILDSSAALSSTLDLQELGAILLRVTMAQSGCRAGFVLVANAAETLIVAPHSGSLLVAGRALAQQAMTQPELIVARDEPFCELGGIALHYSLAMALYAHGAVSGVLMLCDDRPTVLRPGVQEEIALLGNHAGSALRNAALYNQLDDAYTRLQELDRQKSEFISVASHELRTPLSIVLGYTVMLRDQASGVQHEYMQRVLENAQRIRDIVDDMVHLRHVDPGNSVQVLAQVVVQALIAEAHEQLMPIANERQQQFTLDLPKQPITLLCEPEKVLLILGHLISNAIRFTPAGGQISVRASTRPAGPLLDDAAKLVENALASADRWPWALIEVQDTGIGIPDREQTRIFERFYQVADSLTRDHGGIGLGLAVVRELAAAMGGVIWVTSHEGAGSRFTVALPCRQD